MLNTEFHGKNDHSWDNNLFFEWTAYSLNEFIGENIEDPSEASHDSINEDTEDDGTSPQTGIWEAGILFK